MSATRTPDGLRVVLAECPVCKWLTVCDPHWENTIWFTMPCENCLGESRDHLIVVAHFSKEV